MDYQTIRAQLEMRGQAHLLRFYEKLNQEEQALFLQSLESIRWEVLSLYEHPEDLSGKGEIQPISGLKIRDIEKKRETFFAEGKKQVQSGKVGAVLLAGGQGTRLGSNGPKGAYDIGITKPLYIYQQLIRNMLDVCRECGAYVPLYVMTSEKTDEETRAIFEKFSYFGYPKEEIAFFTQDTEVCVDLSGKVLLAEKGVLATAPNGNGGWYSSLLKSGLYADILRRGIEWLNVFAVDNVLQRIADPVFIGATVLSGCNSGAKTVSKVSPDERVGVLCLEDGKPNIIEYYELTDEMANERNEYGELVYADGVILNYLFRVSKLNEIVRERMPIHVVKKKVPYINETGDYVVPQEENGYKFETLILDMIKLMDSCLPFEVVREREFAPIKNRTGIDSVDSARILLQKNGVEI